MHFINKAAGKSAIACLQFVLIVFPFLLFATETDNTADDPSILIYSPSHEQVSYVEEKEGNISIHISAYEPIVEVRINGKPYLTTGTSYLVLSLPYNLAEEPAVFQIEALTFSGKSQKEFTLSLGPKPEPSTFNLITILSASSDDNLNIEPDSEEKDQAFKMTLTLAPIFVCPIDADSKLLIKAIILRDKYSDDKYIAKETAYNHLSAQWIEEDAKFGEFKTEFGLNDIRTDNSNYLISEEHSKSEVYVLGRLKNNIFESGSWDIGLRWKNKDSIPKPYNDNYDADAVEEKLSVGAGYEIAVFESDFEMNYAVNNAKGKYMDYASFEYGVEFGASLSNWEPSIKFHQREKKMTKKDPLKENRTPHYDIETVTTKLKFKPSKETILSLELKGKTQSSNVEELEYNQNTAAFSVTYIF